MLFKDLPAGADLVLHHVAFAGWVGLFATFLNLIPLGQLDGGHIAYALLGPLARHVSISTLCLLVVLGVLFSFHWIIWAGLGFLVALARRRKRPARLHALAIRLKHPPVLDEGVPLGRGRTVLAILLLVIFVLSFIPDPIKGSSLLALLKQAGTIVK